MTNTHDVRSLARLSLSLLGALAIAACSQRGKSGSARITVNGNLSEANIALLVVTVTGSGITPALTANLNRLSAGRFTGEVDGIPVGTNRTFTVEAYNSGTVDPANVVYEGIATGITINPNQTAQVLVSMQQKNHPPPIGNVPPVITFLAASATEADPTRSQSISLTAAASDPDDAPAALGISWTLTGGTLSTYSALSTIWYPPAIEGPYTLTLRVTDPFGGAAAVSVTLYSKLNALAGGQTEVTAEFNTHPTVTLMTASPTQLDLGQTTQLSATVFDADNDTVAYTWSVDPANGCAGGFVSGNGPGTSKPTLRADARSTHYLDTPPDARCKVNLTVTDARGGTNTGSITLWFEPQTSANFEPQIDTLGASPAAGGFAGQNIAFTSASHDPDGPAPTIQWTSSPPGIFDAPNAAATNFRLPCTANHVGAVVATLTVTDNRGASKAASVTLQSTCATSCVEINDGSGPTGFWIVDPDGPGGNAPFNLFCDNQTNGGGWGLVGKVQGSAGRYDFASDVNLAQLGNIGMTAGEDGHYDLHRFDAYASHWTFRATVNTGLAEPGTWPYGQHLQSVFWRPAAGHALTPGVAGLNWKTQPDLLPKVEFLNNSTSTGLTNTLWLPYPIAESDLVDNAIFDLFVFSYRRVGFGGDCLSPAGVTQYCHAPPAGVIRQPNAGLTGTLTAAHGVGDGVVHGHGYNGQFWLKNSNPAAE